MAQMLLFSAARAELASYIAEKLADGVTIICDRWLLSTLVYQGEINGIKPDLILSIFRGTSFVVPDLCVLLDLDPASAEPRMGKPRDRYERRNTEDRQRMRSAYKRYMIDECPLLVGKKLAIVNAELPPEGVHADVYRLYRNAARLQSPAVSV
jgi:dTMP kinase